MKVTKQGYIGRMHCDGSQCATFSRRNAKTPFFEILTSSLNSEKTVRALLESLIFQSTKEFEHIVFDGGSRDDTLDILIEFENTCNLTWISESGVRPRYCGCHEQRANSGPWMLHTRNSCRRLSFECK